MSDHRNIVLFCLFGLDHWGEEGKEASQRREAFEQNLVQTDPADDRPEIRIFHRLSSFKAALADRIASGKLPDQIIFDQRHRLEDGTTGFLSSDEAETLFREMGLAMVNVEALWRPGQSGLMCGARRFQVMMLPQQEMPFRPDWLRSKFWFRWGKKKAA